MSAITEAKTSRFVDVGTLRVHMNEAGSGDPLVLIHGGGPGATGWGNYRRNIDSLSQHFRCLLVDLPGFGKSSKVFAKERGLFSVYAETIRGVLDALQIERAHFIGNSLGGGTTLKFILDYPDRAGNAVLMGSAGSTSVSSASPSEGLKTVISYYEGEGPTLEKMKACIDMMVVNKAHLNEALYRERYNASIDPEVLANPPLRPRGKSHSEELWKENLSGITQRVLLIWGREDRVVPLDMSYLLLQTIPNAQLHVFPKCGHWAQWEKAEEFNPLVTEFLLGPRD